MKIIFLVLFFYFNLAVAETPMVGANLTATPSINNQTNNKNSLESKINALAERKGLDEALKSRVLATYQATQDELNNIATFEEHDNAFKTALKQAPELSKKLQKDIEQASIKPIKLNPEDLKKVPVDELSQRLMLEQDKVKQLDERIKKLENDLVLQESRPNLIRQETLKAKENLDNAQKAIKEIKTDNSEKLENDAQQLLLKTQIDARLAELSMLESENASYSSRLALLKDQLHLLQLQKNALIPLISNIEMVLNGLKEQQAIQQQNALSQAEKELAEKPKVIQIIAKENIKYTQQLQDINNKISLRESDKAKVELQLNQIETDFNKAAKKIDLANLSPPLGKLLHEQRRTLLDKDEFITQSKLISEETVNTDFQQLLIEERLKPLNNIEAYTKQLMASNADNVSDRMITQIELRSLLNEQAELLNKLAIACNNYLHILGDFDFIRQQKRSKAEQFAQYLDENLLWVKSSEALNLNTPKHILTVSEQLLLLSNWQGLVENFFSLPIKQPFFVLLGLLGFGFLILLRKWCVQRLAFISEHIGKIYSDRFYYTLQVLIYDAILVLPLPLITGYIAWLLSNNTGDNFTEAFGMGLMRASIPWFFLQFFYRLFEPNHGVIRQHFQWQEGSVKLIHGQLAWLRFIYVPCSFVVKSTLTLKLLNSDELGRLALNIGALSLIIFLQRLFHIQRGLIQYLLINHPNGWVSKSRYLYFCLSFTPLITIGFCITGYYLSAIELQQKIMITLFFIVLMVIIYELAIRWLNLLNRQLAIKDLQQRRRQNQSAHNSIAGSENPILTLEDVLDIPTINAQTIKILNLAFYFNLIIGFWLIWKNIFPAFSFLEHIELWQVKATVNNKEIYQAITLVNLLLAGVYVFMTVVAVRNFSGAMELLLFRRLTLSAGSRYAVNQLAKYSLITLGFLCVANELGFSWSQVQWLVAALSVGLGFGLQEIFANFVSGIILLFERPIRVGDTVTIGDVSGKVSRIHMRATTLVDFDQKELIVPNKTFITSQLVNWSLSDPITRVVITVGIAYGSDIDLAHKVMLETVYSIPLVLKDPEPSVLLVGFKDSSMEFSIRVFVSETANRMPVTHELHKRLVTALKEHGIEIPFPQRDIHIRSSHEAVK